jgi:hypothetical protein
MNLMGVSGKEGQLLQSEKSTLSRIFKTQQTLLLEKNRHFAKKEH